MELLATGPGAPQSDRVSNATERLYENDPFLFETDAVLIARTPTGSGEEIILNQTVFFATSGGQSHDTGSLEGARVVDVQKRGSEVIHITETPLPAGISPGSRVRAKIDVARRLDHMRQHHGQHLLSAALIREVDAQTVAVHFGAEISTLDLNRMITDSEIARAVDLTNSIVMDDRAVRVHYSSREELGRFKLRREPGIESENLRIIEVEGFDMTPCSGTHPLRTGQVGPVVVVGTEKMRGGTRLQFLCGGRALADAHAKNVTVRTIARDLSAAPAAVAEAVAKLAASEKSLRRRIRALEEARAELEVARLAASAAPGAVLTSGVAGECEPESLGVLAAKIVATGRPAVVGGVVEGRAHLICAAPKSPAHDSAAALAAALPFVDGRGGGNAVLARGSGPNVGGLAAALAAASAAFQRAGT